MAYALSNVDAELRAQSLSQDVSVEIARPRPEGKFTQVPTYWLGNILDNGKASIYGTWLYVFKLSKGPGFVLVEGHVAAHHGIGWRAFRSGANLLRKIGLLTRFQPAGVRKSRAVERLAEPPERWRGYVRIEDRLLAEPADVLAFVAAVHVSPTARKPIEIAKRIGVRSEKTARALQRRASELKAIDVRTTPRGIKVAWPGYFDAADIGDGKFGTAKNGTTKNGASYSTKEDEQYKERKQDKENDHTHTLSGESECAEGDFLRLSDWKQATKIMDMDNLGSPLGYAKGDEDWPLSKWRDWLAKFGPAPKHLEQPFAVKQASEIAREAVSLMEAHNGPSASIKFDRAMIGIAAEVCRKAQEGRTIRSLAIVAVPILKACIGGNWDWANSRPSPQLGNNLRAWRTWAEDTLLSIASGRNLSIDADELLSTCRLEALAGLCKIHGQHRIEMAVKTMQAPEAGQSICGWYYFEPACKALLPSAAPPRRGSNRKSSGAHEHV